MTDGILFCTPMYGGQCTEEYFRSSLALRGELIRLGMPHDWYTLTNESLITRARDVCAAVFLYQTDFSHLMFIDADIGFEPEDVSRLWNLDMPVTAGCYRMKKEGSPFAAWREGRMIELDALPKDPFTVDYAGTGFMLIHREAFERLILNKAVPEYEEGRVGKCHGFFQDPIVDGFHLSEDYFFCRTWRTEGKGDVWMDPKVKLRHVGSKTYASEQHPTGESAAA